LPLRVTVVVDVAPVIVTAVAEMVVARVEFAPGTAEKGTGKV
jgi:hypothetical protein